MEKESCFKGLFHGDTVVLEQENMASTRVCPPTLTGSSMQLKWSTTVRIIIGVKMVEKLTLTYRDPEKATKPTVKNQKALHKVLNARELPTVTKSVHLRPLKHQLPSQPPEVRMAAKVISVLSLQLVSTVLSANSKRAKQRVRKAKRSAQYLAKTANLLAHQVPEAKSRVHARIADRAGTVSKKVVPPYQMLLTVDQAVSLSYGVYKSHFWSKYQNELG